MDRMRAASPGNVEDQVAAQVRFSRRRGAEAIGLIRRENMQSGTIGVGVDGDGGDAEFATGADDAKRDLAAIGDEDFLDVDHSKWGF
jgi:hypothetical protein